MTRCYICSLITSKTLLLGLLDSSTGKNICSYPLTLKSSFLIMINPESKRNLIDKATTVGSA